MIQPIPVREENIFAFKATGKLTDADYQKFLPQLTTLIHKYGPLSLLVELEDFHGWEGKAAWDDFKFGKEHENDFVRIAIVGETRLQKWMTVLGNAITKTFSKTQMHFFSHEKLQDAWDWLREQDKHKEGVNTTEQMLEPGKVELKPYEHILVAMDFSLHSELALKRALELARHYNAELSLLHVVDTALIMERYDYPGVMISYNDEEYGKTGQSIFSLAVSQLEQVAKSVNYPNLQYEVLWGVPKSTVLSYAEAQKVDLIVGGAHGRHGIARLLGSTATGIVHNARCDVIVVKLTQ